MRQSRIDISTGIGLLLFCVFAGWRTINVKVPMEDTIAGPSFLPWLMIGGLVLLSFAMIKRAATKAREEQRIEMPNKALLVKMALFVLLLVLYAAAFMTVGYVYSTFVVFIVGLLLFGERRPPVLVLFPIIMTSAIYYGFTKALGVWLP